MKIVAGIEYNEPTVTVIQDSPLLVGELAGRIAYDSFENSEHEVIRNFTSTRVGELDAESSDLLNSLAWVHHHHSVLEHLSLSYLIEGTSRGVLQELVRHRIASYTVRSTRYTMSSVINAFVAAMTGTIDHPTAKAQFRALAFPLDLFVTQSSEYNMWELDCIFYKLRHQWLTLGAEEFLQVAVAKSSSGLIHPENYTDLAGFPKPKRIFDALQAGKKKRNVGDSFKHIVSDNWKVDMVVTFNLRSLKNYFDLRDSGAAFFQIQWLAQAMKDATPSKYLDLIIRKSK